MSLHKSLHFGSSPRSAKLLDDLIVEWRTPHDGVQPNIIEQPGPSGALHLYVIWDKWAGIPQIERSEVILGAYKDVRGVEAAATVTVAAGLTKKEAKELGVHL